MVQKLILVLFYQKKNYVKTFEFITFRNISYILKLQQAQSHCVLGLIKQMDLLYPLDGKIKHLILFGYGQFNKICDKLKYLISKKSGITNSTNHNFGKIVIDSYNSLPIKTILTFHNVIIFIKSVVNKNGNKYYHNIFLEKRLYKDK